MTLSPPPTRLQEAVSETRSSSIMTLSPPPTRLQEVVSEPRSSSILDLSPSQIQLQEAVNEARSSSIRTLSSPPSYLNDALKEAVPKPLSEAIDDARKAILNMKKCMVCNQLMPKGDEVHKYCLPSTCIID